MRRHQYAVLRARFFELCGYAGALKFAIEPPTHARFSGRPHRAALVRRNVSLLKQVIGLPFVAPDEVGYLLRTP
jgi:hypothetical protein